MLQMEGCEEDRDAHVQTECSRLTEERDEAQRQLKHIKRVSQMVIEEVSVLQTQLDIEKSCRENAEALATKLNCENRKLKYLSLSSRASLDELLPSISDCAALEAVDGAVDDATVDGAADPSPDALTQCQQQVKELRAAVGGLLEEKKSLACQLLERQRHLEELSAQAQADRAQLEQLRQTVEQQSKTLKRFNRVSMMATQEFEGMKEQLDLEQSLRVKAESYAHEMLVKQKEANRQSMLLLQSAEPSVQLLKALEDLAAASKSLEEERQQHQQELRSLEAQLQQSAAQRQLEELRRQLELLEVEKKEVEGRLEQTEKRNQELEGQVRELQASQEKTPPPPPEESGLAPPPAPPPQPPPSLIAIMRKSSKGAKAAKAEQPPAAEGVDDVKVKAVNEMMERIKHGVVLRPVKSPDSKQQQQQQPPPAAEEKPQESAMDELKGILDTVKRSPSRGSQEPAPPPMPAPPLGKKDSELEVILRRRRNKAGEAGSGDEGGMSQVSSSDSLSGRPVSSDSGREPDGPAGLSAPPPPAGPRLSPDRRGSGPGPAVARRKSSDSGRERRSSSSLSGKHTPQSPVNGCVLSVGEEERASSNGVDPAEPREAGPSPEPLNGRLDAAC